MKTYIKKGAPQYKANLHSHSTISDGNLTPEEMKQAYRDHGYSILSITDHEVPFDHSDMNEKDFLMLTGYEAYIRIPHSGKSNPYKPEIHINLFAKDPHNVKYINFNESYCKYIKDPEILDSFQKVGSEEPREYTVEYINSFVQTAKENGYLCTYNHAVWSLEDHERISAYEGFFSMEMCNYSSYVMNAMEYNGALYDRLLREGKRLFCHSADDNHNGAPFDSPKCDSFGGFTMVLANDLSYPSVIDALENGDFYSSMGPQILELSFDGAKAHIETENVKQIIMFCGGKKTYFEIGTKDEPVSSADFEIPEKAPYVRFSVIDFEGKHADTRAYFRDELGI